MEIQPGLRFLRLAEMIRRHFDFLFRRGFELVSILFVGQNYEDWQVTIATDDCMIKIYSDRGKVDLALGVPQLYNTIGLLELSDLIYAIDGEEGFSISAQDPPIIDEEASLRRIAQLLEKYIDNILERIRKMLALLSDNDPAPPGKLAKKFQYN